MHSSSVSLRKVALEAHLRIQAHSGAMQIIVVSDPTVATEVLQMPKVMDKNRQAIATLDLVNTVASGS